MVKVSHQNHVFKMMTSTEQVYYLELRSNHLSGTLPSTSTAWNFTHMEYLVFQNNSISGGFSDAMAEGMPKLSIVAFSNNFLIGGVGHFHCEVI